MLHLSRPLSFGAVLIGSLMLCGVEHVPVAGTELAVASGVSAVATTAGFTIEATVRLPRPCDTSSIAGSKEHPGQYDVLLHVSAMTCSQSITARTIKQHFNASPVPKSVMVNSLGVNNKPKVWTTPVQAK